MAGTSDAQASDARFSRRTLQLVTKLTFILLLVGYLGVFWLPFVDRGNFFDENALLIGSAASTIRNSGYAALDYVLHTLEHEPVGSQLPGWLSPMLDNLASPVDLTTHTFTREVGGSQIQCHNFHAVLRAPSTDGTDSILLVTPVAYGSSTPGSFNQTPEAANLAVALGASMVAHLASVKWLARDVIWLVTDARCGLLTSVQAWVDAYRLQAQGWDTLDFHRGGLIRQALVLEVPDHRFSALELSMEGFDGRLPNLDLYWVVTWLATHYVPMTVTLESKPSLYRWLQQLQLSRDVRRHVEKSLTLLEFMWRQAKGLPTGAHAPLLNVGVDAVTLRLIRDPRGHHPGLSGWQLRNAMAQLLDVTEGTIRGCNNLLESLHHSYKLYLQSSRDTFISIDMYIIPFTALFLVLLVRMILLHLQLSHGHACPSLPTWICGMKLLAGAHAAGTSVGLLTLLASGLSVQSAVDASRKLPEYLLAGAGIWVGSETVAGEERFDGVQDQRWARLAAGVVLIAGAIIVELGWAVTGRAKAVGSKQQIAGPGQADWRMLKLLLLCTTAMGAGAVACINWSLAMVLAGLLLPLVLGAAPLYCQRDAQYPPKLSLPRLFQLLVLALVSSPAPALLLQLLLGTNTAVMGSPGIGFAGRLAGLWDCSTLTCMVAWSLYAPIWAACIWMSVRDVDIF